MSDLQQPKIDTEMVLTSSEQRILAVIEARLAQGIAEQMAAYGRKVLPARVKRNAGVADV
jgi:hypothetical protein